MPPLAGSLGIRGTLDTTEIESGYARITAGFESIKGQAKSFGSDMERVSHAASGLAKKLTLLGIAGAGTMVALAKSSPAVAPALAKMDIAIFKLSNSLGRALAPAFERVAGWLDKFGTWISANEGEIGIFASRVLDVASALGTELWPYLKKIGDWALEHPKLFTGIVAGLALGPTMIAGIGAIVGLATTLGGLAVSASALTALGYVAAIAAAGYAGAKIGEAIGGATYEPVGKGFVESGVGSWITTGIGRISDFFTGGNATDEYLKALAANRAREEDRRFNLLNMDDATLS